MPDQMLEKGKDRPDGPASREADPRNTEQQAGLSGDNDADRIQTEPTDKNKEETDNAYLENTQGGGTSAGANNKMKEAE